MIFTSRHHACESTGSYVLEGVLQHLLESENRDYRYIVVPFVDYDGVIDGEQGKFRFPHDHNRGYMDNPIYPEGQYADLLETDEGVIEFRCNGVA